jgi:hypothetical protein
VVVNPQVRQAGSFILSYRERRARHLLLDHGESPARELPPARSPPDEGAQYPTVALQTAAQRVREPVLR